MPSKPESQVGGVSRAELGRAAGMVLGLFAALLAVPLIAISGYSFAHLATPSHELLAMSLQYGATRYLRKPFTPKTLIDMVESVLAGCVD